MRHGTACALLANVNRHAESRPEPYKPEDFVHWVAKPDQADPEPVVLDDPVAHSNLLRAALFGIAPK